MNLECLYLNLPSPERNWFTLGSPRCFKNKPDGKVFVALYEQKMNLVQKRVESMSDIAFLLFC